jgi:hypothetical protein
MKQDDIYLFEVLQKSGWREDRKVDQSLIVDSIHEEGYLILPRVIEFLQEFWGLKILFENKKNGLKNDDINFSFEEATHLEVPERVNGEYSKRTGKELCLIGSVYREYMVLVMANDGSVYGGYDSFLCKIADTGMDAIKAIIFDYPFVTIE